MDEPGFIVNHLCDCKVAIWGLGLMGGSLAMALQDKCDGIFGIDCDMTVIESAVGRQVVQRASANPSDVLDDVDVIILATPACTILQILDELPMRTHRQVIVIDLGSTKRKITQKMGGLPRRFDVLGGHPMCGKEKGSLANADPTIYQGATFALVALERTSARARQIAQEIAQAVGSIPFWIDADQHDRWVAITSHAPFLLASALVEATPAEVIPLIGPGFRSSSRLAGNPSAMMVDILVTNRDHLREALYCIQQSLQRYEQMLDSEDFAALGIQLTKAEQHYRMLTQEG